MYEEIEVYKVVRPLYEEGKSKDGWHKSAIGDPFSPMICEYSIGHKTYSKVLSSGVHALLFAFDTLEAARYFNNEYCWMTATAIFRANAAVVSSDNIPKAISRNVCSMSLRYFWNNKLESFGHGTKQIIKGTLFCEWIELTEMMFPKEAESE